MPDPHIEIDIFDRAVWAQWRGGMSIRQDRLENSVGDQFASINALKTTILKQDATIATQSAVIGEMRERLEIAERTIEEMKLDKKKLTEHLKRRFAELRDEFKADRSTA
jgi:hypothetical protein